MNILKINEVITQMNIIQQIDNITDQCLTNSQFLYQYILKYKLADNCFLKSVITTAHYPNTSIICVPHIVLDIDGVIYDPSYQCNSHSTITYFTDYDTFMSSTFGEGRVLNGSLLYKCYNKKVRRNDFNRMCKIANSINKTKKVKNVDFDLFTHYTNIVY